MNKQPASAATRLWQRHRELSDRLTRLDGDVRRVNDPLSHDFPDQAVQRQNDEVVDRLRAITALELDEIDAALAQIAAGTYGFCERCDEPIESARLAILPQSTLCELCARLENRGRRE